MVDATAVLRPNFDAINLLTSGLGIMCSSSCMALVSVITSVSSLTSLIRIYIIFTQTEFY